VVEEVLRLDEGKGEAEGMGKERKRGQGVAACQRYATLGKRMERKRTGDKCCLRVCSPHFLFPAARIRVASWMGVWRMEYGVSVWPCVSRRGEIEEIAGRRLPGMCP